jgi:hypothetical protein
MKKYILLMVGVILFVYAAISIFTSLPVIDGSSVFKFVVLATGSYLLVAGLNRIINRK